MIIEERLAVLETKVDELIKKMDNHLVHHFRYNIMIAGVALAAIVGLIIK